jgi:hypothetical protein
MSPTVVSQRRGAGTLWRMRRATSSTRATGSSTADLALLLVSANDGLTRQTRRHAIIVSTLSVRRFVPAINKMDLVGWSESRFAELRAKFSAFVRDLDVDEVTFIPLSARDGALSIARNGCCGTRGPPCWNISKPSRSSQGSDALAFACQCNTSTARFYIPRLLWLDHQRRSLSRDAGPDAPFGPAHSWRVNRDVERRSRPCRCRTGCYPYAVW